MDSTTNSQDKQLNIDDKTPYFPFQAQIPKSLVGYDSWVNWDYQEGVPTPIGDPGPFKPAYQRCMAEHLGLGFVLSNKDPFVTVHIDRFWNAAGSASTIEGGEMLELLNTYAEETKDGGVHAIAMSLPIENVAKNGVQVWADGYMIPLTGEKVGLPTDPVPRDKQVKDLVYRYCAQTWMDKVAMHGDSGTEEEILGKVLEECLSTPGWRQDGRKTELYAFLGLCWGYPELQEMVNLQLEFEKVNFRSIKSFHASIEAARPKKERQKRGRVADAENGLPTITHSTTEITGPVDEIIAALMAADAPVWQRDGEVVTVMKSTRKGRFGMYDDAERLRITVMEPAYLTEIATNCANHMVPSYYRNDHQYYKAGKCPTSTIDNLLKRPYQRFDTLTGIVTVPTLRHDGSIIVKPGYDKQTGLFYSPIAEFPEIIDNPTKDDAMIAVGRLHEPFRDFPISENYYRSAAMAAILSIMSRHLVRTVPLFAVTSTTRGSGKGLIVNVICTIAMGEEPTKSAQIRDDDEMRKRLLVIAMDGDRTTVFDNVTGIFGTSSLDMALTEPFIKERVLGLSKSATGDLQTTFFLTGNNVRYFGDMARRVIPITFTPDCENPEERTGFHHPNLLEWVQANQPQLMVDALTVLQAYIKAGKPKQKLTPYGSFEMWSDLVRSALVWVGMPDPCLGRKSIEVESDDEYDKLQRLLHAWSVAKELITPNEKKTKHTMKEILASVKAEYADAKLKDLGESLAAYDSKSGGKISEMQNSRITKGLKMNGGRSRIIDGMHLRCEKNTVTKINEYWLEGKPTGNDQANSVTKGIEGDDDEVPF